jgi:vacuolar-type H+-ATPase subunit H
MPMSSSAVVNRAEVLDLIGQLEASLPSAFADQDKVYAERDTVVGDARADATGILAQARAEAERLTGETEVFRVAKHEAAKVAQAAEAEAEALRRETDDYIDTRLATFEISLTKTLEAVSRGRARLQGRSHLDTLGDETDRIDGDLPLVTPDELRTKVGDEA